MPDANNNSNGRPVNQPLPVPAEPEKVGKPLTEEELRKKKYDALKDENDDKRSERRANELKGHLDLHFEYIKDAQDKFPTPNKPFEEMTEAEKFNWNLKRLEIDSANKAYNRAVKETCLEHLNEDRHLTKLRMKGAA